LLTEAFAPIVRLKVLNERFEDLVNDGVKSCNCMFRDFTENDVIVIGALTDVFLAAPKSSLFQTVRRPS
jgi:hypothetical protein